MKLKDRIKTYNFWVSLSSAIFLIIKVLGNQIGFRVDESLFSDLITSLCSILVILGIIVPPTKIKNEDNALTNNTLDKTSSNNDIDLVIFKDNNQLNSTELPTDECNKVQENLTENQIIDNQENFNEIMAMNEHKENTKIINENEVNLLQCTNENNEITDFNIEEDDLAIKSSNQSDDSLNNLNNTDNNLNHQIEISKSKFQNQLKIQENLFANNIEEYIKILEIELESLKNR